jgi:hypothetical protein
MATYYLESVGPRGQVPAGQADGSLQGGHVRIYGGQIDLSAQPVITTADTIVVALPSKGERFLYGVMTASVSMGGVATLAVGVTGTTGKYRTAAGFTVTETPTLFGAGAAGLTAGGKLATDEVVFITIAGASLPASGILRVDLFFAQT